MRKLNLPTKDFGRMSIFLIEAIGPYEMLQDISEGESLKIVCNQIGHDVAYFKTLSESDLENACNFIKTIPYFESQPKKKSLCIHLSAHGNESGLTFGDKHLSWEDIFNKIKPIFEMDYDKPIILCISACNAKHQKLTLKLKANARFIEDFKVPKYIFVTADDEVPWARAIVGWTILYHQLPEINISNSKRIQEIIDMIDNLGLGKFRYYRWDQKDREYKKYPKVT